MAFFDTFNTEFKTAMKTKDEAKLSTLRMLKAALKNKQIELLHELSEEEALAVVKSQLKLLKDSLESFEKGGRADLAENVRTEITVLEAYLPAQMDEAALKAVVAEALKGAGITSKADMGKAMGIAMKAVAGQADGTRVKSIVASLLSVLVVLAFLPLSVSAATSSDVSPVFLESGLRIARMFFLLMGIVCVNTILVAAFTIWAGSGSDHAHHEWRDKLAWGLLGSILMAALFSIATVAIQRI